MPPPHKNPHRFTAETFEGLAKDLKSGRLPLDRVTVSDNQQVGLRAIVRNTGLISFHVDYNAVDSRKYIKIGDFPEMSISRARNITSTIHALAARGIDPQAGLHEKLIKELEEKGPRWRP